MTQLPNITSAFLNLTNACNLACRYCFVEQRPTHMSLKTAKEAADFLAGNASGGEIPSINFFGGEPMLMWDEVVVPLTRYIREKYGKSFSLSMTSNCTLMDEERARFMAANGIGLLFSMDGDRETQDRNRPCRGGASSFDLLEPKLELILRYFPDVMFRATVTPDTQDRLFENMMFAEGHGFRSFFVMPDCFEPWPRTDGLAREMRKYSDHYIACMEEDRVPIFFTQMEKHFKKILLHNAAIRAETHRAGMGCRACGKCGLGGGRYAGVNINGDLTACQEFFSRDDPKFYIGNIYSGAREDLRQALLDEFDGAAICGDGCEACPLDHICDGGCVANNYMIHRDIHRVPDIYCFWERLLFREAVYIMNTLGQAGCERFRERWDRYVG